MYMYEVHTPYSVLRTEYSSVQRKGGHEASCGSMLLALVVVISCVLPLPLLPTADPVPMLTLPTATLCLC